jgi:hypothetical protein
MKNLLSLLLCLSFSSGTMAQLKINEILYDPSNTALEGDANGDGAYDQVQDEFIEFVNTGDSDLDVSKYKIFDRVKSTGIRTRRHTMVNNLVIPPNGALVVFGGGTAVGTFGGARVEIDLGTTGLSLGNSGEVVILEDSLGNVVDSIDTDALSDNPNESYTRNPDVTGTFVQHGTIPPGKLFSPGLKTDGSPFNTVLFIKINQSGNQVRMYPNPARDRVVLKMNGENADRADILDLSGKVISSQTTESGILEVAKLPAGIYQIRTRLGQNTGFSFLEISK